MIKAAARHIIAIVALGCLQEDFVLFLRACIAVDWIARLQRWGVVSAFLLRPHCCFNAVGRKEFCRVVRRVSGNLAGRGIKNIESKWGATLHRYALRTPRPLTRHAVV